jgi:hypothetical protein
VASVDLTQLDLWCKVDNENFAPELVYKPIAYLDYGESATGQLLFVTDEGALYALPVTYTRIVRGHGAWSRKATVEEVEEPMFEKGYITGCEKGERGE